MNGVLSWLVRWACRVGTRDFCSAFACSSRPSTIYFFPHRTLFPFLCPHRPASWACSRAGSPFSQSVSLVKTLALWGTLGHRLNNNIDTKAFVCFPLKLTFGSIYCSSDSQSVSRPFFACYFLGMVNIMQIPIPGVLVLIPWSRKFLLFSICGEYDN